MRYIRHFYSCGYSYNMLSPDPDSFRFRLPLETEILCFADPKDRPTSVPTAAVMISWNCQTLYTNSQNTAKNISYTCIRLVSTMALLSAWRSVVLSKVSSSCTTENPLTIFERQDIFGNGNILRLSFDYHSMLSFSMVV